MLSHNYWDLNVTLIHSHFDECEEGIVPFLLIDLLNIDKFSNISTIDKAIKTQSNTNLCKYHHLFSNFDY